MVVLQLADFRSELLVAGLKLPDLSVARLLQLVQIFGLASQHWLYYVQLILQVLFLSVQQILDGLDFVLLCLHSVFLCFELPFELRSVFFEVDTASFQLRFQFQHFSLEGQPDLVLLLNQVLKLYVLGVDHGFELRYLVAQDLNLVGMRVLDESDLRLAHPLELFPEVG